MDQQRDKPGFLLWSMVAAVNPSPLRLILCRIPVKRMQTACV
jgi:hypothetical protein